MAKNRGKGSRSLATLQNRRPTMYFTAPHDEGYVDPLGLSLIPETINCTKEQIHCKDQDELRERLNKITRADVWIDTCFFCANHQELIKHTLMSQNRLMVASGIERELSIAKNSPMLDPAFNKSSITVAGKGIIWEAFDHYFTQLKYRKIYGERFADDFLKQEGRYPDRGEFAKKVSPKTGSDGEVIAWDGHSRRTNPNRFHDEELVTTAFLNALHTKRPTIILTADEGVVSQFVALSNSIESDWVSMLVAQEVSRNLEKYEGLKFDNYHDEFYSPMRFFNVDPSTILNVKPHAKQVIIGCWKLTSDEKGGVNIVPVYKLISPYAKAILTMKKESGGRNTDVFGDGYDGFVLMGANKDGSMYGGIMVAKPKYDSSLNMSLIDQRAIVQEMRNKAETSFSEPEPKSLIWTPKSYK
jgi:hypothetical protein